MKMFLVTVFVVMSVTSSRAGVLQPYFRGGLTYPLLANTPIVPVKSRQKYVDPNVAEKTLLYSISHEDYLYLQRHRVEGKDSPYNPDPTQLELFTPHQNTHVHGHGNGHGRDPSHGQTKHHVSSSDSLLKRSVGVNSINGFDLIASEPISPVVHKHVYFHVPPPEFEEPPPAPRVLTPPNKTINLVFIKVPSQELSNYEYQQQLAQSRLPIDDKTLIYVLSKNQEAQSVVPLPPKHSVPEVFFVNYKTDPTGISPINAELPLQELFQNVSPAYSGSAATLIREK